MIISHEVKPTYIIALKRQTKTTRKYIYCQTVSVFLHLVCSELRQYKNVRALLLFQYKSTHFSVATKKKSVTLSETSSTYSISL